MSTMVAFTVAQAARVAGISERRVRYWDRTGVLKPSIAADTHRSRAYNRIYSFRDVVGLRTLGILCDRYELPLQKLRAVCEYLQEWSDSPWSGLRFHVLGSGPGADILFRHPVSDMLMSATQPGQGTLFEVEPIALDAELAADRLSRRTPAEVGKIVRHRYVLSNRPVLAGTRVPTVAVWEFHKAGYDTTAILREYPRLTAGDIEAAIAFEEQRHRALAG